MTCPGFKDLIEWEADQLRRHPDELEAIDRHAGEWRASYCRNLCKHARDCELARRFVS